MTVTILKIIKNAEPVPSIFPPPSERPCWKIYDEPFEEEGRQYKPGVYWHDIGYGKGSGGGKGFPNDTRICGPLYISALTSDPTVGTGGDFGRVVEFKNLSGKAVRLAIPGRSLVGDGVGVLQKLAALGFSFELRHKDRVIEYMFQTEPSRHLTCATSVGWCSAGTFVLPNEAFGPGKEDVVYQSGHNLACDIYGRAGTLEGWQQNIAARAVGNPMLVLAISASFVGPLLRPLEGEGGGLHFVGPSSMGKSTILAMAGSVWGSKDFRHTWRTTSNALEGIAEMHSDNLLPLDEISECDPAEVARLAYMLAQGEGKNRADRLGGTRPSKKWIVMVLSTGERSVEATLAEGRFSVKAGQLIRILDISAERTHGCFDNLHDLADGRGFADALKAAANEHHGEAGRAFLKILTAEKRDLKAKLAKLTTHAGLRADCSQAGRGAARFALIALAGELATEYGITGWTKGAATKAAIEGFQVWQEWRGRGNDEPRRIAQAVLECIEQHSDSRFSIANECDGVPLAPGLALETKNQVVHNRAGWWKMIDGKRIYLFSPPGLRGATKGFDFKSVVKVLADCGVLLTGGSQAAKLIRIQEDGRPSKPIRAYHIDYEGLISFLQGAQEPEVKKPSKTPPAKKKDTKGAG